MAWEDSGRRILRRVLARWKLVALYSASGAIAGTATVLLLPSYYRSEAAFQAENNAPSLLNNGVAGLATQVGLLQLGSQNGVQFLGDLLPTDAVLRRVAHATLPGDQGATTTLYALYRLTDEPAARRDFDAVRRLRSAMDVDVNPRTNVVRFSLEARTPELAQALTDSALVALNAVLIDLRQSNGAAEQSFASERAALAQRELRAAEDSLAIFSERNRAVSNSPALQMREAELRRNADMAQQVYVQLRILAEQAQMQATRNTPSISVIDKPQLPILRSRPKRRQGVALGLVAGFAVALTLLLLERRDVERS